MQPGTASCARVAENVADTPHERIRRQELELAKRWIRSGSRVLEIGGGSGFQAALLAAWGFEIVSIDLEGKVSPGRQGFGKQYWPVESYDGRRLPFGDGAFDVVYSSHMLYHVETLPAFLGEIQRVLRPGGLALHLLPSASWRWWTSLTYYIDLAGRSRRVLRPRAQSGSGQPGAARSHRPWSARLKGLLRPPPLGPSRSAAAELFSFRRAPWVAAFRQAGFERVEACGSGLFYTGYLVLPGLPFTVRRWLARLFGSSCHVFAMRRPAEPAQIPSSTERASGGNVLR
jgi:SAM-dependent methyltransferase